MLDINGPGPLLMARVGGARSKLLRAREVLVEILALEL
jgi:hypothetical protein